MSVNFALYNSITYTLSTNPDFPLTLTRSDLFVNRIEAGYPYTRPRFTRILRQWKLMYSLLISNDITSLNNLFNAIKYSDIFTWYNPEDSQSYVVRLKEMPIFNYVQHNYWNVEIVLEEV